MLNGRQHEMIHQYFKCIHIRVYAEYGCSMSLFTIFQLYYGNQFKAQKKKKKKNCVSANFTFLVPTLVLLPFLNKHCYKLDHSLV